MNEKTKRWIRRRLIFWLVIAPVSIYFGLMLVLYVGQDWLLFQPTAELEATPADMRIQYEDVTFRTADGVTLHGWYVPAARAKGTVLFCHGNAGNISHRIDTILQLNRVGLSVLMWDYRGYGRSEGRPSEEGTYADAAAAWAYLRDQKGLASSRIIVHGRSLGTAVATQLAAKVHPAALVLESPFVSVPSLVNRKFPFYPAGLIRLLSRTEYGVGQRVRAVKCPVLVMHSPEDEVVPFAEGHAVYNAAPEPKMFVELRGGHNGGALQSEPDYSRALKTLIRNHLPHPPTTRPG